MVERERLRAQLYNALLRAVKENGVGMERGLIIATLMNLIEEITNKSNEEKFDSISGALKEWPYWRTEKAASGN